MARFFAIGFVLVCGGCRFHVDASVPPASSTHDLAALFDLAAPARDLSSTGGDLASSQDLSSAAPDLLLAVGQLDVSGPDGIPGTVDLGTEGTIDWAHCGYLGATGIDDRKSGGPGAFTIAAVGGVLTSYGAYATVMTWSDGAPNTNGSTRSGIYNTGNGHGISVVVPADTTARTLRLYITNYQSTAQLQAQLSDGSATSFSGTQLSSGFGNSYYRYTIVFRAAKSAQTLTLKWMMTKDAGGGSVDLLAATLY